MLRWFELILGLLIWVGVLWDGFATIVLPRTVAPLNRLSGRFNKGSWWLWAAVGRRIANPRLRLNYLAVYGPISVMLLLVLWAGLLISAFALIFDGLGVQFQAASGSVGFATLLYMSGSTFLTLGLGDVTSPDALGRFFMILEVGTGYTFLGLMITYMPILHQAYGSREVGNLLIQSRAGSQPGAISLLQRYSGDNGRKILQANLREAELWMVETQQSHLEHPVLTFYRAQHWGQSWLVSVAAMLDSCALLMVGEAGLPAAQATLTYRMGAQLLEDLTEALGLSVDPQYAQRLTETKLPALIAAAEGAGLTLSLSPIATMELLRLVHRYDAYLVTLASWLVISVPPWIPQYEREPQNRAPDERGSDIDRPLTP